MIEYNKNKYKYILLYLAYISLAILTSYPSILAVDLPFPTILVFIFLLFTFFLWFLSGYKKDLLMCRFHFIVFFLFIRTLLFFINAIYLQIEAEEILMEILMGILSIFLFTFSYNYISDTRDEIKNIFLLFTLITSAQIIILLVQNAFLIDKSDIVAGVGYSNYAAGFLLFCVAYLLFIKINTIEKIVVGIGILALLLTQSFAAYLTLMIIALLFLIIKFNWKKKINWLYAFLIFSILIGSFVVFCNTSIGAPVWQKIKQKIDFFLQGDWDNFGSSRGELFNGTWANILRSPFFGVINNAVIVNEELGISRAHNFFLESLVRYGIIGSLCNIAIVVFIVLDLKGLKKFCPKNKACLIAVLAALLHGLLEPNLFTLRFELFFWLIIGALLSQTETRRSWSLLDFKSLRQNKHK